MSAFVLTIALSFAFDLATEEESEKDCARVVAIEVAQIACLCVAFLMTACLSTSRIAATIKVHDKCLKGRGVRVKGIAVKWGEKEVLAS